MLHFNRLQAGSYISDCRKYVIACVGYPPKWNVYRIDCNGEYTLIAERNLLCLAKTAAEEDYKTNIDDEF